MSNNNNNQEEMITQNNNKTEETKAETEIEQDKNINKKRSKRSSNQKNSVEISENKDNSKQKSNEKIENNITNSEEMSKNKENMKSIIKEQNELLTKEREYLKIIENLKIKIKNIEQVNKNEIDKKTSENNEKENRIQILSQTNEKMKQSYNALSQRMEQLSKNINKKNESQSIQNSKKMENLPEDEKEKDTILQKDKEIKKKQKYINILSKENQNMKQSIDRYYELDINKNITKELFEKEQLKIKLENEIKELEKIVKTHNKECTVSIEKLKKELNDIESRLNIENSEFHNKNKDYFHLQCKFSLQNKEDEEEYLKFRDKKNFLDMNKHIDFLNYDNYNNKKSLNSLMYNKKKEFSRDLERGKINNYERSISLPKIDVNPEKKVISSLFTQDEIANLQILFLEEYQDEDKFEMFMKKINELEKGNSIEDTATNDINEECLEKEKDIRENEELIRIQEFKLKELNIEITDLNQKCRTLFKKNLLLKKEENNLKNSLEEKRRKNKIKLEKEKKKQEMEKMLNDINNMNIIEEEEDDKKNNKNEEIKYIEEDNINNNEEEKDKNKIDENAEEYEEYEEQNYNNNEGEEAGQYIEEGEEE